MKVSGYSMDLYCRNVTDAHIFSSNNIHDYKEFPHRFTGETNSECKQYARKKGWVFNRDGDVTCPKCA